VWQRERRSGRALWGLRFGAGEDSAGGGNLGPGVCSSIAVRVVLRDWELSHLDIGDFDALYCLSTRCAVTRSPVWVVVDRMQLRTVSKLMFCLSSGRWMITCSQAEVCR
jgi:hypothetical protein